MKHFRNVTAKGRNNIQRPMCENILMAIEYLIYNADIQWTIRMLNCDAKMVYAVFRVGVNYTTSSKKIRL